MHGVKRVKQSEEALEARRKKEKAKLTEYLALTDEVLAHKREKDHSKEALELTTRLLRINPELYTVWNYRRNIMLDTIFPQSSPEEILNFLLDELASTMAALKANPKVYWIWNHRRWCLESIPSGPGATDTAQHWEWKTNTWERELKFVEKMLEADPRNFHAWNYRRYILAGLPVQRPGKQELYYTKKKIESSISNFSAWHQRSKTITILREKGEDSQIDMNEEFELLRNAMYTDPNDQSVWVYHRWIVGSNPERNVLEREINAIRELWEIEPDSKWCMESLVHYKRLLVERYPSEVDVKQLRSECQDLLEKLQERDPYRKQRYRDLALQMGSSS